MLRIYNTLTRRLEEFKPIEEGKVGIYACGVTVYDESHIGHLRSAICFDVIRRYLTQKGYIVKFVCNFTDIDDKVINRANELKVNYLDLTREVIEKYFRDVDTMGILRADVYPKATEHIPEIILMVKGLEEKGFAYNSDGDVYFDILKITHYGKLSNRTIDEMISGTRKEPGEGKRHEMDFALWKKAKPGEPSWDSPWGKGRPGWHIECSAMSAKYLGAHFDIHGGGLDLVFPHHENEIAQSEAYTEKKFVNYWVHNGLMTVNGQKMAKSLGNFITLTQLLNKYDRNVIRLFFVSVHYRSPLDYSGEKLNEASKGIDRIRQFFRIFRNYRNAVGNRDSVNAGNETASKTEEMKKTVETMRTVFMEDMDEDFNSAGAIARIYELINSANRYRDFLEVNSKEIGVNEIVMLEEIVGTVKGMLAVLGFSDIDRDKDFGGDGVTEVTGMKKTVDILLELRNRLRKKKDYENADFIRNELLNAGIIIEDTSAGSVWKKK